MCTVIFYILGSLQYKFIKQIGRVGGLKEITRLIRHGKYKWQCMKQYMDIVDVKANMAFRSIQAYNERCCVY